MLRPRAALILALLAAPALVTNWPTHALAADAVAPGEATVKAAFDSAKELGTVEAWDAFLASYPTGFYSDLARAYVKKMGSAGDAPADAATAPAAPSTETASQQDQAGSWGGIVRSGPGQAYRQLDVLNEGEPVVLLERTAVMDNGYPWFKISYRGGQVGYKWGGILCAIGTERPDLFKTCPTVAALPPTQAPLKVAPVVVPKTVTTKPLVCAKGYTKVDGRCILKRDASTSCGPGFHLQGSKCVAGYKPPPPQQQLPSWQVQALKHGCAMGEDWNAAEGCHPND